MEERRLGGSDVAVQRVIFGAWAIGGWYWGGTNDDQAIEAIRASIDAGIQAIDTAPIYGCGHSEVVVGRAIAGRRQDVTLLTKVGLRWDDDRGDHFFDTEDAEGKPLAVHCNLRPESIRLEVERSLERLGVDDIDLVQCHWPDPTTPVEESMGALARLVEEGKVRAIGVSNFDVPLLERARQALATHDLPLASDQPRYSLLDRSAEPDVLRWCRQNQVGAIVYSPLEQGLLTGKVTLDRVFPEGDGRRGAAAFLPDRRAKVLAALDQAREIAHGHDCTLAQLALAWCLHRPGITATIAGARTPEQAQENAAAAQIQLDPTEVALLAERFAEVDA
jgi:aryl-alcohol dehydrogenase-like predicted oxidoreductase